MPSLEDIAASLPPMPTFEDQFAFCVHGVYAGPLWLLAPDESEARRLYHRANPGFDGAILRVEHGDDDKTAELRERLSGQVYAEMLDDAYSQAVRAELALEAGLAAAEQEQQ